jgi:hypothetical protein
MATRRYSIARGETEFQITEAVGAATATKSMEFTFDLAVNLTREDVLLALEKVRNHIIKGSFPPA